MQLSIRACVVALALGGLSACATPRADTISFDRGAFGLYYGDVSSRVKAECAKKPPAACAGLEVLDAQVRDAILNPPKTESGAPDLSMLLPLLIKLGALAL